VEAHIHRAAAGITLAVGMGAFFFAVLRILWLFCTASLLVATIGLALAIHRLDCSEFTA
jgi:hypothetical protein